MFLTRKILGYKKYVGCVHLLISLYLGRLNNLIRYAKIILAPLDFPNCTFLNNIGMYTTFLFRKKGSDIEDGAYKPNFFNEISRQRSGGIDVSKHSKTDRKIWWKHIHEPTPSPPGIHRSEDYL